MPFVPDMTLMFFENEKSRFSNLRYFTTLIFLIKEDTCLIYTINHFDFTTTFLINQ